MNAIIKNDSKYSFFLSQKAPDFLGKIGVINIHTVVIDMGVDLMISAHLLFYMYMCSGYNCHPKHNFDDLVFIIKIITAVRAFNARTKVIIFCKSRPFNWQLEDNNQHREIKQFRS